MAKNNKGGNNTNNPIKGQGDGGANTTTGDNFSNNAGKNNGVKKGPTNSK